LITPTTPVRPMPLATSSQRKASSLSPTMPAVRCTVVEELGILMEIAAPGGDLVGQIGDAVDDAHDAPLG
jgi:hypothetical protein